MLRTNDPADDDVLGHRDAVMRLYVATAVHVRGDPELVSFLTSVFLTMAHCVVENLK